MKIIIKLALWFALAIIIVAIAGYGLMSYVKAILEQNIGMDSVAIAEQIQSRIDRNMRARIGQLSQFLAVNDAALSEIKKSNEEFESMAEPQEYIDKMDEEWKKSRDSPTEFMLGITSNSLSGKLRQLLDFYERTAGFKVFGEMFITNRFGTIIGTTGITSDYRQDDEDWWQKAKKDGLYIEDISYDESAGIYSLTFALRIDDSEGNFIGVMKAVYDVREIFGLIDSYESFGTHKSHETMRFFLMGKNDEVVYSTAEGALIHDLGQTKDYPHHDGNAPESGYAIIKGNSTGEYELYSHAHASEGMKILNQLGWWMVVEHSQDEIFEPLIQIQNIIFAAIPILVLVSGLTLYFAARSVSRPLKNLVKAAEIVSQGNLEHKVGSSANDEIGELSRAFDQMAEKLMISQKTIARHNEELESQVSERTRELGQKISEMDLNKKALMNIMEDVDETNRQMLDAQGKLKDSIGELKKLDVQKDQFISIAAHELKTPLTSIKGFADLLTKENVSNNSELRKKYLSIIYKDTQRLGNLISNILELSRMDLGTMKLSAEKTEVSSLINEVKEQMDIIIKSKGLDSEFVIEEKLPAIFIDKDKTVQALSNLINNAVHYTDKGKITIEARKIGDDIRFGVSDTGVGIPKEYWPKIFTRFYQVDSPLTRKIGGTGLGLSISRGFIEAMGGKIWFESEVGKGTTFYFTIPCRKMAIKEEKVDIFRESKEKGTPTDKAVEKFKGAFEGKSK